MCTACLAAGCTHKDLGPSQAALKAFNCLLVNDVNAFLDTFDIPEADKPDFHAVCDSTICKAIAARGGIVDVGVSDETLSDDGLNANVTVVISYSDGSSSNIALDMVNKGGRWMQRPTI